MSQVNLLPPELRARQKTKQLTTLIIGCGVAIIVLLLAFWFLQGQKLAGIGREAAAPATLAPAAVYPAVLAAFGLKEARVLHLLFADSAYYREEPSALKKLPEPARDAYGFLFRFRFGAGEPLPAPDHALS